MPAHPQLIKTGSARSERPRVPAAMMDAAADYLTSVNLSSADQERFSLKRLLRPEGPRHPRGSSPNTICSARMRMPHDVIVEVPDGYAWYSDFGNQFVGEPGSQDRQGDGHQVAAVARRPAQGLCSTWSSIPTATIWVGMSYQAGASKVDRKTKEVKTYPLPPQWANITTQTNMVTPTHMYVDNKVWMTDTETHNLYRLDLKTGQWDNSGEATLADGKKISGYGLPSDKNNNVYMFLVRRHPDRACSTPRPTWPRSGRRRCRVRARAAPPRRPGPRLVRRICRQRHRHELAHHIGLQPLDAAFVAVARSHDAAEGASSGVEIMMLFTPTMPDSRASPMAVAVCAEPVKA